jgi:hypothetical protein
MPTQHAVLSHAQINGSGTPHAGRHAGPPETGGPAGCALSAIRLVPVPETGPPFDGEPPGALTTAVLSDWPSGAPPLGVPACVGVSPGGPPDIAGCGSRADGSRPEGEPGRSRAEDEPGGSRAEDEWSWRFALLLTETLAGARPLRQLLPWTAERARGHLDRLMPLFSGGQRPRVQRVITSRPTRDAIEMTLVVGVGARTRAIAVRLERVRRPASAGHAPATRPGTAARTAPRWLCTDIEAA